MSSQNTEQREELADDLTPEQIQSFIDERIRTGAISCEVVTENGQRILVCQYPPI